MLSLIHKISEMFSCVDSISAPYMGAQVSTHTCMIEKSSDMLLECTFLSTDGAVILYKPCSWFCYYGIDMCASFHVSNPNRELTANQVQ